MGLYPTRLARESGHPGRKAPNTALGSRLRGSDDTAQHAPIYLRSVGIHDTVDPSRSTLIFGRSFIGLGMLALVTAVIQHTRILQRLEAPDYAYNAMRPITVTVAIMLLMIGAFGLVGILL
jgi:hypothetical protein